MPEIGQTISHYRIVEKIGEGGMGQVFLAEDTTLDRKVALKFLPEAFTSDPERMARFEREAKLLASLNHPNIAGIYGLEQADGNRFLVLEYVEGETLQARLGKGALPLEDALELCRQIAEGLEAAHEKGVIHRDLKPANVMITAEEKVKILDFGLAKAFSDETQSIDSSQSPTLTEAMTRPGVILGTAAYMSPEQAKGKSVDKRADIWAFGCILYECLTGKKAFEGETVTETLAAVLKEEPDWNGLPANAPQNIRFVLHRCLEKNKDRRFRDMADVWINIEHSLNSHSTVEVSKTAWPLWKKAVLAIVPLIIGIAIGVAALWNFRSPASAEVIPFSFILPEYQFFTDTLAISPDGTKLVYGANRQLYLKWLSQTESQPIPGTQDAYSPFFSPDGEWIGFYSSGWLKKVFLNEGTAVPLCEASYPYGVSWWNDTVIFSQGSDGIYTVSEDGGSPEILVEMEPGEFADGPQMLPSGDAVLFALTKSAGGQQSVLWDKADIVVFSQKTGKREILFKGGCHPRYVSGHIIYALGNDLWMFPFDYGRLKATGSRVQVMSGIARWRDDQGTSMNVLPVSANPSLALFDLSNDGTLAYIPSSSFPSSLNRRILALVDRNGRKDVLDLPPDSYDYPRLSPDGEKLAVVTNYEGGTIWIYDMSGKSEPRRLTYEGINSNPVWNPESNRLAYYSNRDGKPGIFLQSTDGIGVEERITELPPFDNYCPNSWSPDGKTLLFTVSDGTDYDIWEVTLTGEREAKLLIDSPYSTQAFASFSPDGQSVAYMAGGSNGYQIYVQSFPKIEGNPYPISREGRNDMPAWSPSGRELYYWSISYQKLMAVPIQSKPTYSTGQTLPLGIEGIIQPYGGRAYDIMPDGKQFLVMLPETQIQEQPRPAQQVNFVLYWFEELKERGQMP